MAKVGLMRRNIAENLNRLSRVHECCRRQTDGRAIAYSEREREFTFAKNKKKNHNMDRTEIFRTGNWADFDESENKQSLQRSNKVNRTYFLLFDWV